MKIIISESRLDKVIEKAIHSSVGDLTEVSEPSWGREEPEINWYDEQGNKIFSIILNKYLVVNRYLYEKIASIFGLTGDTNTIDKHFLKFVKKNLHKGRIYDFEFKNVYTSFFDKKFD